MSATQQLAAYLSGLLPDASEPVQGVLIITGILLPMAAACGLAAACSWAYGRWV